MMVVEQAGGCLRLRFQVRFEAPSNGTQLAMQRKRRMKRRRQLPGSRARERSRAAAAS
jgi:hypothetical protein